MRRQLACCALGIALTAAPALLGYDGAIARHDQVLGPVIASVACVAAFEATRALRYVNAALGLWLVAAPFVFAASGAVRWSHLALGALLLLGSASGRRAAGALGGGWPELFRRREAR